VAVLSLALKKASASTNVLAAARVLGAYTSRIMPALPLYAQHPLFQQLFCGFAMRTETRTTFARKVAHDFNGLFIGMLKTHPDAVKTHFDAQKNI
jgi:hypothetical protein